MTFGAVDFRGHGRNIVPYIRKFGKNPVTGKPMEIKDLIKLHFHKNSEGEPRVRVYGLRFRVRIRV